MMGTRRLGRMAGDSKIRVNGNVKQLVSTISSKEEQNQPGFGTLVFCVGGIYASLYVKGAKLILQLIYRER